MRWLFAMVAVTMLGAPAKAANKEPKRRVIRLDVISVEGHIQKPEAFYILPRTPLNYQSLARHQTFLPKITKALDQDPF